MIEQDFEHTLALKSDQVTLSVIGLVEHSHQGFKVADHTLNCVVAGFMRGLVDTITIKQNSITINFGDTSEFDQYVARLLLLDDMGNEGGAKAPMLLMSFLERKTLALAFETIVDGKLLTISLQDYEIEYGNTEEHLPSDTMTQFELTGSVKIGAEVMAEETALHTDQTTESVHKAILDNNTDELIAGVNFVRDSLIKQVNAVRQSRQGQVPTKKKVVKEDLALTKRKKEIARNKAKLAKASKRTNRKKA